MTLQQWRINWTYVSVTKIFQVTATPQDQHKDKIQKCRQTRIDAKHTVTSVYLGWSSATAGIRALAVQSE